MVRSIACTLGLLCAFACGAPAPKSNQDAKAASEPAPSATPPVSRADLQSLISREIEPLALQTATDAKGAWSLQVEGRGVTQKPHEGSTEIVIDLGTTQAMTCFVYQHGIDVGGTLAKLIATTGRQVQYQVVAPVAAVPLGDTPAIIVDAVYLAKTEAGQALGELKIGVYGAQVAPVLCLHDEPGYRASFTRVVTGLIKSLKKKAPEPPQFVELHLARMQDVPLGYYRRAVYQTGKTRTLRHWGVMLFAASPSELRFEDSETVLELDQASRLEKGLWVKALNGQLSTRIDVQREAPSRYKFSGTHEGKPVSGSFQVKDKKGLFTELSVAEALRTLKGGKPKPLELEEYHPGLDASQPVRVRYTRDAADATKFQLSVSDTSMNGVVDEQGLFKRLEAGTGDAMMVSERVLSTGKL